MRNLFSHSQGNKGYLSHLLTFAIVGFASLSLSLPINKSLSRPQSHALSQTQAESYNILVGKIDDGDSSNLWEQLFKRVDADCGVSFYEFTEALQQTPAAAGGGPVD